MLGIRQGEYAGRNAHLGKNARRRSMSAMWRRVEYMYLKYDIRTKDPVPFVGSPFSLPRPMREEGGNTGRQRNSTAVGGTGPGAYSILSGFVGECVFPSGLWHGRSTVIGLAPGAVRITAADRVGWGDERSFSIGTLAPASRAIVLCSLSQSCIIMAAASQHPCLPQSHRAQRLQHAAPL